MTRQIAIIHPYPSVRGGAEGICFELISALLEHGDQVTLFTAEAQEQTKYALIAHLGEALAERVIIQSPIAVTPHFLRFRKPPALLGYAFLLRALRKVDLSSYSLLCSTFGECDLIQGPRQVCYIHFPVFAADKVSAAQLGGRLQHHTCVRLAYVGLARRIASFRAVPEDAVVLTNSNWTKRQITRLLGLRSIDVVYPPVRQIGAGLSISTKTADPFACLVLGRFEPYKRPDIIADALRRAAVQLGQRAEVHFAGRGTQADVQRLRALASNELRVHVHQDVSADMLQELVKYCHIGAAAFRHEHFGMATAELLSTGMPVFVPNGGGQPEVASDPRFVFENPDDLAMRIMKVMDGSWPLTDLQKAALACAKPFAPSEFAKQVRASFNQNVA